MIETKQDIIEMFARETNDTGSPEVQVAIITARVAVMTKHMDLHKKDYHSRLGLIKMIKKRARLLKYLKRISQERYEKLISILGIRR